MKSTALSSWGKSGHLPTELSVDKRLLRVLGQCASGTWQFKPIVVIIKMMCLSIIGRLGAVSPLISGPLTSSPFSIYPMALMSCVSCYYCWQPKTVVDTRPMGLDRSQKDMGKATVVRINGKGSQSAGEKDIEDNLLFLCRSIRLQILDLK